MFTGGKWSLSVIPSRFLHMSVFSRSWLQGPIERASHLVPQFMRHREFSYGQATDGLRQILWGLFKKNGHRGQLRRAGEPDFRFARELSWIGAGLGSGAVCVPDLW